MNSYRNIGKIVGAFGVLGEMILLHHLGKKAALKGLDAIFIEENPDVFLPYFIESAKAKTNTETLLKLEGINTREAVKKILQKSVWLPEEDFLAHSSNKSPIAWVGFHLLDNGKDLGEILEVIEQPHQVLCKINWQGREALIPLHEATLQKIDVKSKRIYTELPDGLLDIF